jgi:hypothetical protein
MIEVSQILKLTGGVSEYSTVAVRGAGRTEEIRLNITADGALRIELEGYPAELSMTAREALAAVLSQELSRLNASIKKLLTQQLDITLLRSKDAPAPLFAAVKVEAEEVLAPTPISEEPPETGDAGADETT